MIRPIGGYFPLDAEGYLINPTGLHHLSEAQRQLITSAAGFARQALGPRLHSLWLRGSYARGMAVDTVSDLDLFALIHDPEAGRWRESVHQAELAAHLRAKFGFIAPVELMESSYSDDFVRQSPRMAMLIATQSCCLAGEDIRPRLPHYRPGPELMLYTRWWPEDVAAFLTLPAPTAEDVRQVCKQALRTAFESVMEEAGSFTPDLFYCAATFARYRPAQAAAIWQVLWHYVHPEREVGAVRLLLQELVFGEKQSGR